jgi:hypothetical protein
MATSDDEFFDPFEAHFRREPLTGGAVRLLVVSAGADDEEAARTVASSIEELLRARGRGTEAVS